MMKIKVILPNEQSEEKEFEAGTTPEKVLTTLSEKPLHQIYACKLDNYYERLNTPMTKDGTLSFCDISNSYGNMAMQGSLILLYCAAVHEVVGKSVKITIANSLSKGLFTIIHDGSVNEDCIHKIEKKMSEMVREDLPIGETVMNRRDTMAWLKAHNMKDEMDLYESAPDLREALVCTLKEEEDLQYYHTVPSTGYLKLFELRKYRNGILLRFPHPEHPDEVSAFEEQKLLYDAFSEETHWENLCGVNFASDLNHCVENNSYKDLIQISEALHEKKIAEIADKIRTSHKRIILIAGPSSSGKTSFAKRLCIQLQVIGLKPLYLGTDDYFVNREDMIVGPDGKKDLEGLSAVDVRLFTSQMNDLLAGKKVDLPTFDFIKGEKIYGKRITSIDPSQPIVIEGIHGLNPEMTDGIPAEMKFKIYISPLTQLNLDLHHRVPTTDARMLRRMVRDYRTRGRSAAVTIDTWSSVRAGEDKNIFPYNSEADAFFNSQCIYELAVLKKYAEPLLKGIHEDAPEYAEAQRMLQFLQFFVSIQDDSFIANNSIIREFIGGSILVD
jgi:Uridine kinase